MYNYNRQARVISPLEAKFYKKLRESYQDPVQDWSDFDDSEAGVKEIDDDMKELAKDFLKGESVIGDIANTLGDFTRDEFPKAAKYADCWQLEALFNPLLEDAKKKLEAAEAACKALDDAFEAAIHAAETRSEEMGTLQEQIEKAREREEEREQDRAYAEEERDRARQKKLRWF